MVGINPHRTPNNIVEDVANSHAINCYLRLVLGRPKHIPAQSQLIEEPLSSIHPGKAADGTYLRPMQCQQMVLDRLCDLTL